MGVRMPLESLHIENYGCIRDARIELTPLHAFIGPNDSGKSTILRAAETLGQAIGSRSLKPELLDAVRANQSRGETRITGMSATGLAAVNTDQHGNVFVTAGSSTRAPFVDVSGAPQPLGRQFPPNLPYLAGVNGSRMLRLDPDALRQQASLLPDSQPLDFANDRGLGLPAVYDALVNRNVERYLAISEDVRRHFPFVKAVRMQNINNQTKAIAIELHDGQLVPASLVSEGLLYYLAFAVLPDIAPAALVLIDEPENGLHPARVVEVMNVLREVSKGRQVLLATHSPLVVNELGPDEVSIVKRTAAEGTTTTVIKDTPNFAERSKVYALGELWVSYANGTDEAPLLQGGTRP
jgi:ABC-type branched-subunit amino acid transport system ATPase component